MKEIELKIPNLGEAESTEIIEINAKPGDKIEKNDPIIVLESEKAAMEVPSDYEGTIKELNVKEGEVVSEGMVIGIIEVEELESTPEVKVENIPQIKPSINNTEKDTVQINHSSNLNAGPAVRKIARELEIDLTKIKGTGKLGLITKEDLRNFVNSLQNSANVQTDNYPDLDSLKLFGEYEIETQSKIKKLGAKNLHRSWVSIPHVTHFDEIDITSIEIKRRELNKNIATKLTPLSYLLVAVLKALKEFPIFNSSLIDDGKIMLRNYFNIGIAVDTENGLVVPVIKDADKMGLEELALSITSLAQKAKQKKLLENDLSGGTFTISSLGQLGGTGFTPIINPPEVGIIGVSKTKNIIAIEDGSIVEKTILPVVLSYDHRVINGADAGKFVNFIKDHIEKSIL